MDYLSYMKVRNSAEWLAVCSRSNKRSVQRVRTLKRRIRKAYSGYGDLIEGYKYEPPATIISRNRDRSIVRDLYNNPPSELKRALKERRMEHGLEECPYCGSPNKPDTLDHFMPKEDWPEYSILPNNLIPQCRICASTKGRKYYENGSCKYISPIYSDILSKISFNLEIGNILGDLGLEVSVKVSYPENLGEDDVDRIFVHLKSLNVRSRIVDYSNGEFKRLKRQISRGNISIVDFLSVRVDESKNFLDGNWRSAFYKALLNSEDAISDLQSTAVINTPVRVARTRQRDL